MEHASDDHRLVVALAAPSTKGVEVFEDGRYDLFHVK
jgi:hypothetical protein